MITAGVAAACAGLALAEGAFEPTAYAAIGLASWLAVVIGIATGALPRARPPGAAVVTGLCLGGFALWTAISIVWASEAGSAFEEAVRAFAYLGLFVLAVVCAPRARPGGWLRGLAVGLVAVAAIALLARFEPDLFGNPDAEIAASLPAAVGRLTYPVGYWNGLAAMMAAAVVVLAWLGARGRTAPGRALAVGALPLVLLALWATDSRGGIAAAALAAAVLVAAGSPRWRLLACLGLGLAGGVALVAIAGGREEVFDRPGSALATEQGGLMLWLTVGVMVSCGLFRFALDRPLAALGPRSVSGPARLLLIGGAALLIAAAIVVADPVDRWQDFKQPPVGDEIAGEGADLLRTGGSGRYQYWESAVDAYASAPVAGLGAGGYGPWWLEHREVALIATRAHSLPLESLAELGIAGLALIVGFFAVAAITGVHRLRNTGPPELGPALAVLTAGAAVAATDWTWDLPAVALPTLIAAAVLSGPATLAPGGADDGIFGTAASRRRFAGGVAVLLVAWVSICASGLLLLGDRTLESSRELSAAGDTEGAVEAANDAIDLQPWAAEPRTQLALLYERERDLPAAREALAEAIDRASRDFELYLLAARFAFEDGDFEAAEAAAERARELNPLDAELRAAQ